MQAHQRQSAVAKAEVPARDAPELRLLAGGRTEAPYLYSTIPTIGTLFVLTFVGATLIGLALLAPSERLLGRFGRTAVDLFALGGAGLAATAFVFLYVSERDTVVRLRGAWLRPACDPGVPHRRGRQSPSWCSAASWSPACSPSARCTFSSTGRPRRVVTAPLPDDRAPRRRGRRLGPGFGFLNAQDELNTIAPNDRRAEVTSAFISCIYLVVAISVVASGLLDEWESLTLAVGVVALTLAAVATATAAWQVATRSS